MGEILPGKSFDRRGHFGSRLLARFHKRADGVDFVIEHQAISYHLGTKRSAPCSEPSQAILPLARPATIPRARASETGQKAISYHLLVELGLSGTVTADRVDVDAGTDHVVR
jgi:hypothetical protein